MALYIVWLLYSLGLWPVAKKIATSVYQINLNMHLPRVELRTCCVWDNRDNHYTTDAQLFLIVYITISIHISFQSIENPGVGIPLAPSANSVVRVSCWRIDMNNFLNLNVTTNCWSISSKRLNITASAFRPLKSITYQIFKLYEREMPVKHIKIKYNNCQVNKFNTFRIWR